MGNGAKESLTVPLQVGDHTVDAVLDPSLPGSIALNTRYIEKLSLGSEPRMIGRSINEDGEFPILSARFGGAIRLGTHEIELSYEKWSEVYSVSGPRLVDILSAVGAQGRAITATAVDGYAVEVSAEELTARDWIVVLERNGRPLDIGGLGPLWIVYAVPGNTVSHDDVPRCPWAVFFIEVH